ncbi:MULTISPECIES: hypothetical protein [Vibrio]|uniref:hypothetical protein n=1 Tax=Vibrio TaxID=662 RepID=UPI0020944884|nr:MULTISPECIES: hypothetical protein [Vibrio]MCO7020935.1 hypothetical protein [Vibrio paracholerae]MCX9579810.1 hypothetical protein [Vibrio cholerae]
MNKKTINFTADKVTHQGVEVSAEGVPVEDIVNSINEYDAAEHLDNDLLLGAIGEDAVIAWLEEQGHQVI